MQLGLSQSPVALKPRFARSQSLGAQNPTLAPLGPVDRSFYDGDFRKPRRITPYEISYPIQNDSETILAAASFAQHRDYYSSADLRSIANDVNTPMAALNLRVLTALGPIIFGKKTYLVDQSGMQRLRGKIIRFNRSFASLPNHRVEGGYGTKTYQYVSGTDIFSYSRQLPVTVYYDYFLNSIGLKLGGVPTVVKTGPTALSYLDGFPVGGDNSGTTMISIAFHRWMGNIWECVRAYG